MLAYKSVDNLSPVGDRAVQKRIVMTFFGNPMSRSDGCHTRVLDMLTFLSSIGFQVIFYSFRNYPIWPWSDNHILEFKRGFSNAILVLDEWTRGVNFVCRLKNAICLLVPGASGALVNLTVPLILPAWSNIKRSHPDAVYLVNYAHGSMQLNGVDLSRTVVETHDLSFRNYALSRNKPIWRSSVVRRLRREMSLLEASAIVISIAANEQAFLELMVKGPKVCYVPPRITRLNSTGGSVITPTDMLFVGSSNIKNIVGINSFLTSYRTWRAHPSLTIAGDVCEYVDHQHIQMPSVKLVGYVSDLPSLYRSVSAVICPVEGTGVNIKIMEALAYGKPVFAFTSASAALPPGSGKCVYPLTEKSVCALLGDAERLQKASQCAFDYVDSPFIRAAWSRLHDELQGLMATR